MRLVAPAVAALGLAASLAEAQPPAAWVTVAGRVVLPPGVPIPPPKPPPTRLVEAIHVNPDNRGVQDVFVWLRPPGLNPNAAFGPGEVHPALARPPAWEVTIDHWGRDAFEPRAVAARAGDSLVVRNRGPQPCRFLCSTLRNGDHDSVVAAGKSYKAGPLVTESPVIMFSLDQSPVRGAVRVFDHPYFAVTDPGGRFELPHAPVGNYQLVVYHLNVGFLGGRAGRAGNPVVLAPGKDGRAELPRIEFDVTK